MPTLGAFRSSHDFVYFVTDPVVVRFGGGNGIFAEVVETVRWRFALASKGIKI
jgi:hypothetical protein